MVKTILVSEDETHLGEAVDRFKRAGRVGAFTGAGISVESGIPDFRSPGGVWTIFAPEDYATLDVFLQNPGKAWRLYRELGRTLLDAQPNPSHTALARLEKAGRLDMLVTQNVDHLHQDAGSEKVIEVHGDHQHLQCLRCDWLGPLLDEHMDLSQEGEVPLCPRCESPLKPNVVLFGEGVRGMGEATSFLESCDLLLVVGTSAQVYPAAGLPGIVQAHGGSIYEFNLEATDLTRGSGPGGLMSLFAGQDRAGARSDFFFHGSASASLTRFVDAVLLE